MSILALEGVAKRFVKPLDMAARAANVFGASMHEAVIDAVDDVHLAIDEGEVVGLVGESGCGKSTLGRGLIGLLPRGAAVDGELFFDGVDVLKLPDKQRTSVAYHYLGGLPYREIASITGGSEDAARRAAADGIKKLRASYLPAEDTEGARR